MTNYYRWLLLLCFCLPYFSQAHTAFLKVDEAFRLSAHIEQINTDESTLVANFIIAPKYYLYRNRITISNKNDLASINFPAPNKTLHDGDKIYSAYAHEVTLYIPIKHTAKQPFSTTITYQGCAEAGLCYPPTTKQLHIDQDKQKIVIATPQLDNSMFGSQQQTAMLQLLRSKAILHIIVGFFIFGLLLSFTPCVLPMIPIISSIITNQADNITTAKAFRLSLTYVLSMSFTYAVFGIAIAMAGNRLQAYLQSPWVLTLFSGILVLLALSLFGYYELQLPRTLRQPLDTLNQQQRGGSYIGVAIMGILATLIVSPCVSPPLVAALGYISQTSNGAIDGGIALFSMGIGMGLPLLIIGTSAGKLLPRSGSWMHNVKNIFGVLLLAMAIWLLGRVIPDYVQQILWGSLCLGSSVYLGAIDRAETEWQQFRKIIGLILLVYGVTLFIDAHTDHHNPLQHHHHQTVSTQSLFQNINTVTMLEQQLKQSAGRITMVDFYADWCIYCQTMERDIFPQPDVHQALSQLQLLRIDVTQGSATQQALLDHLQVIGPPALLFFDSEGNEIKQARIVGEVDKETLLHHVEKLSP